MALLAEAAVRRPANRQTVRTFDSRLLSVYLRDHHALLFATRELARRMSAGNRAAGQRAFAAELSDVAADDLACLEALLARLGSAPSHTREGAVWAAEKLGRLKLNGRILRPSPLSAVTELEGCRLLLEAARALWSGLADLTLGPDDADERSQRGARLLETAEQLRRSALQDALHPRVTDSSD
jgi:hypothetical protein